MNNDNIKYDNVEELELIKETTNEERPYDETPYDETPYDSLYVRTYETPEAKYAPTSNIELIKNVLIQPRKSMAYLIDRFGEKQPFFLIYILGMIQIMDGMTRDPYVISVGTILGILIFAIISGYIELYLSGFFIRIFGKIFKGKGKPEAIRTAILWSNLPMFLALPFGIITFTLGAGNLMPLLVDNYGLFILYWLSLVINLIAFVWSLVLQIKMISEVHKISSFKAFICLIFPFIIVFVLMLILVAILAIVGIV